MACWWVIRSTRFTPRAYLVVRVKERIPPAVVEEGDMVSASPSRLLACLLWSEIEEDATAFDARRKNGTYISVMECQIGDCRVQNCRSYRQDAMNQHTFSHRGFPPLYLLSRSGRSRDLSYNPGPSPTGAPWFGSIFRTLRAVGPKRTSSSASTSTKSPTFRPATWYAELRSIIRPGPAPAVTRKYSGPRKAPLVTISVIVPRIVLLIAESPPVFRCRMNQTRVHESRLSFPRCLDGSPTTVESGSADRR